MKQNQNDGLYVRLDFASETVDGQTLIISHQTGQLLTLNKTASFIWQNLKKPITLSGLLKKAEQKFDRPSEQDLVQTLKTLEKAKLLTYHKR